MRVRTFFFEEKSIAVSSSDIIYGFEISKCVDLWRWCVGRLARELSDPVDVVALMLNAALVQLYARKQ